MLFVSLGHHDPAEGLSEPTVEDRVDDRVDRRVDGSQPQRSGHPQGAHPALRTVRHDLK